MVIAQSKIRFPSSTLVPGTTGAVPKVLKESDTVYLRSRQSKTVRFELLRYVLSAWNGSMQRSYERSSRNLCVFTSE